MNHSGSVGFQEIPHNLGALSSALNRGKGISNFHQDCIGDKKLFGFSREWKGLTTYIMILVALIVKSLNVCSVNKKAG